MPHVDRNGRPLSKRDCVTVEVDRGETVHGWVSNLPASGEVEVVFGTCGAPPMSGAAGEDWDYGGADKAVFSSRQVTYRGASSR